MEMLDVFRRVLPRLLINWYHLVLALVGAAWYRFPSRQLVVIGVTGTDGKSTTHEMIVRVLRAGGHKVAATSSVWFQMGERKELNHLKMGMPGRFFLQRFLREAVEQGCTHAVIEVSSEGILQHRHSFIRWHTAVVTNLSPEHIDRHGSFDRYKKQKLKLFAVAKHVHVVNGDDAYAQDFLRFPHRTIYIYGTMPRSFEKGVQLLAEDVKEGKRGTTFKVDGTPIALKLLGKVNVYNALAALCVGESQHISREKIREGLEGFQQMPGRMEVVIKNGITALVDYAVTPAALTALYQTLRRLFRPRKLICVIGSCGGGRDRWKRPVLGKVAATYCDHVIITNEDPYDENPEQIIEQIAAGANGKSMKVLDRREAIRKAFALALQGDLVVATGKGSEDAIAGAGGKKTPWNEAAVMREEFAKKTTQEP